MNFYDPIGRDTNESTPIFLALVIFAQVFGIICVVLTGAWLGAYWGGFDWSDPRKVFNYHPLFMVLGLVFLYGDALLVYRVFRNYRKLPVKVLHGVLHLLAFVFASVGIKAVFDMHNLSGIPNMYSLHSWLGIVALVLFGVQWIAGLLAFLIPPVPQSVRAAYLPLHVSFGGMLYLFIIGVCVAGITEKNTFSPRKYASLQTPEILGNVVGVCLVIFGSIIFYLISQPSYRRVEQVSPERRALNEE